MFIEKIASQLKMDPMTLERESLKTYLERRLRLVEADMLSIGSKYGVKGILELDQAIREGKFHEEESFDDYFALDNLEDERDGLLKMLKEVQ